MRPRMGSLGSLVRWPLPPSQTSSGVWSMPPGLRSPGQAHRRRGAGRPRGRRMDRRPAPWGVGAHPDTRPTLHGPSFRSFPLPTTTVDRVGARHMGRGHKVGRTPRDERRLQKRHRRPFSLHLRALVRARGTPWSTPWRSIGRRRWLPWPRTPVRDRRLMSSRLAATGPAVRRGTRPPGRRTGCPSSQWRSRGSGAWCPAACPRTCSEASPPPPRGFGRTR